MKKSYHKWDIFLLLKVLANRQPDRLFGTDEWTNLETVNRLAIVKYGRRLISL